MYVLIEISNQMLEDSAFDHAGGGLCVAWPFGSLTLRHALT